MTLHEAIARRERSAENVKFSNDASLGSVELLLIGVSAKCFRRVSAMGLPMCFEDVRQEMYVSYLKAKEKWSPDGGALFSTYCTTVCINNFNAVIKKMETERREIGLISASDIGVSENGEEIGDPFEKNAGNAADATHSPEYRLESAQETQRKLKSLSRNSRALVSALLASERRSGEIAKLRDLAKDLQINGPELKRVKIEILATFGVKWQ